MDKEWEFRNKFILEDDRVYIRKYMIKKIYLMRWYVLYVGYVKINFDRSIKENIAIIWCVIRNYKGKLIKVRVSKLGEESVIIVEVIILRNGI